MNNSVTIITNRYYIKTIVGVVSILVMIFVCIFPAYTTLKKLSTNNFTSYNCFINCITGLDAQRIILSIPFLYFLSCSLTFITLFISQYSYLSSINCSIFALMFSFVFFGAFFASIFFLGFFESIRSLSCSLYICSTTFTIYLKTIFMRFTFMKAVNVFCFFASWASFCYDLFSHVRFLSKRTRLKPVAGHIPVIGLFYYHSVTNQCQIKNR